MGPRRGEVGMKKRYWVFLVSMLVFSILAGIAGYVTNGDAITAFVGTLTLYGFIGGCAMLIVWMLEEK